MPLEPQPTIVKGRRAEAPGQGIFRISPAGKWARRILGVWLFLAVFGDFLANEKPLYCRVESQAFFPILWAYAVDLGLGEWPASLPNRGWRDRAYDAVIWPPIPWSATTIDRQFVRAIGPFSTQEEHGWRFRHWLGTDPTGRDVAAGMIRGARVALVVGLGSMSIALVMGLWIGACAGYFGDRGLRLAGAWYVAGGAGVFLTVYFLFVFPATGGGGGWGIRLMGVLAGLGVSALLGWLLERIAWFGRRRPAPLDAFALRALEVLSSLPGLLIALSLLAIVRRPSLGWLVLIIGLLSWTGIARFTRAEMMRIRELEYIEAARAIGLGDWRILWRHALPNGMRPVFIALAFGISGSILMEAYLSFLGIGLPVEEVSWGSMLGEARGQASAWWLALFPGLGIFSMVLAFNLWGEQLADRPA